MTGAIIEKRPREIDSASFGKKNETVACEYRKHDCVFLNSLAVAHRAAPEAHMPADQQRLRIVYRGTVRGVSDLTPGFGLPPYLNPRDMSGA